MSIDDEVTRVEGVRLLEGASGHGVLSLLFLGAAGLLVYDGANGAAVIAVVIAYGVALNGLSIYAWDRLRARIESVVESGDEAGTERTLTPYRVSAEMKAELVAGFLMIGGFVLVLGAALTALRTFDTRQVLSLLIAGLGLGNLVALGWAYYSKPD